MEYQYAIDMATFDEGCPAVTQFEHFCHLNATLSCSENFQLSLKKCFPIAAVAAALVAILVTAIIIVAICLCLRCTRKRKPEGVRKTIQGNTEEEPLITSLNRELDDKSLSYSRKGGIHYQAKGKMKTTTDHEGGTASTIPIKDELTVDKKVSNHMKTIADPNEPNHGLKIKKEKDEHKEDENPISCPVRDKEEEKERERILSSDSHKSIGERVPNPEEDKRSTERTSDMHKEKDSVDKLAKNMFKHNFMKPLPDLGSRLQKYWFQMNTKSVKGMQIIVKSSRQCRLNLQEMKQLDLLKSVFEHLQHPCLHRVHDVAYKDGYVGILQDFMPNGSIRDYLHMAEPHKDWADKYTSTGDARTLPIATVANCASQVLKAVKVLYDIGFEYIGQIQSGNVFLIDDSHCVLGGFENTLLGFRTSCFASLQEQNLLEKMDVVMFGHLIYEMCCGRSLLHHKMMLSSQDIEVMEDQEARNFVKFIFECAKKKKKTTSKDLITEISKHKFLENVEETHVATHTTLTFEMHCFISEMFTKCFSLDAIMLKLEDKYFIKEEIPRLGWRSGKMWAKVRNKKLGNKDGLLTAVAVPDSCPIFVSSSIDAIKRLFHKKHLSIINIRDVDYVNVEGLHVIVVFQDWEETGSMKDYIYKCRPLIAWDKKYQKGTRLQLPDVNKFGEQILQAMIYWSGLLGDGEPLTLGHIHTGNIFVFGNSCRVGGLENTLLGFKTRKYGLFEDYQDKLDAFMFGHVIYEMSTGMELETAVPTEKDLKTVPRELHQVFHYIFQSTSVELQKILDFFRSSQPNTSVPLILEPDVKYLLKKVKKGKARNQDDKSAKIKDGFNRKLGLFKTN